MSSPRISLKPSSATPTGALAGAAVASILAGVLVFSATGSKGTPTTSATAAPVSVIVADRLIPKGSSGEAIASGRIARPADVRSAAVASGAVLNISDLRGQVAAKDIYPGEQLTAADFTATGVKTISAKLTGSVRGIAIPLDAAHGLVGQVEAGDHVDVYASLSSRGANGDVVPTLKPIALNVEVLRAPPALPEGKAAPAEGSVVTLRMVGRKSAELAYASDNGKVWMVLRPPTGAVENSAEPVTLKTLMASGSAPIVGTPATRSAPAAKSTPTPRKKVK